MAESVGSGADVCTMGHVSDDVREGVLGGIFIFTLLVSCFIIGITRKRPRLAKALVIIPSMDS